MTLLVIFGFNYSIINNPNISQRLQRTPSFQFDEKIIMNVSGAIGDKFDMDFKYDTEATFDFDQKTKLEYAGEEDEILKLHLISNKKNIDVLCGLWHPEATLALLAGFKNVFVLGHGTEFLAGKSTFRK